MRYEDVRETMKKKVSELIVEGATYQQIKDWALDFVACLNLMDGGKK